MAVTYRAVSRTLGQIVVCHKRTGSGEASRFPSRSARVNERMVREIQTTQGLYGHGCVNVHFSLLPKYRGAAPANWAIVNGEEQTGVTTMQIVQELDAGPILLQKATKIGQSETAPELMNRLADMGAEWISETLANL